MNKFSKKTAIGAASVAAAAALVAGFAAPAMAATSNTTSGNAQAGASAGASGGSTVTASQLGALENLPTTLEQGQFSAISPIQVSASVTVGTHTSTVNIPGDLSSLTGKLPTLPSGLPSVGSLPSLPSASGLQSTVTGTVNQLTNTLGLSSLLGGQ